jgi:hypothetical protein
MAERVRANRGDRIDLSSPPASSHQGVPSRIAAIRGDGIGTEVIATGVEVPHTIARRDGNIQFAVDHFDGAASTARSTAA